MKLEREREFSENATEKSRGRCAEQKNRTEEKGEGYRGEFFQNLISNYQIDSLCERLEKFVPVGTIINSSLATKEKSKTLNSHEKRTVLKFAEMFFIGFRFFFQYVTCARFHIDQLEKLHFIFRI